MRGTGERERSTRPPHSSHRVECREGLTSVECGMQRHGCRIYCFSRRALVIAALALSSAAFCRRHRCILTVGSIIAQRAGRVHASRHHHEDPRAVTATARASDGHDSKEREGLANQVDADLLAAGVPERDLPAYRALLTGMELHVRELT